MSKAPGTNTTDDTDDTLSPAAYEALYPAVPPPLDYYGDIDLNAEVDPREDD